MKASCLAALVLVISSLPAFAADDIKVAAVLSDLNNPTSVAIRPDGSASSYELFVAESGARRVIKIASDKPNAMEVVITDFPEPADDSNDTNAGNPRGLLFLDHDRLATGMVGNSVEVRLYELGDKKERPVAEEPKQAVKAELPNPDSGSPSGGFVGFARTRANDFVNDMLMVASVGSDSSPTMWRIPIRAGTLGSMTPLEAADGDKSATRSSALTVSPQGYVVRATQRGARDNPSELAFQNPKSGQVVMRLATGMRNIVGLQYGPRSGNLYALGTSKVAPSESGVFRIDDAAQEETKTRGPSASPMKVADVARPTGLAFGPDGALYVTAQGEPGNGGSRRGVLLKLTGEL